MVTIFASDGHKDLEARTCLYQEINGEWIEPGTGFSNQFNTDDFGLC